MEAEAFARLIDDHARFPDALAAILPIGDLARMRERESEERWSLLEILAHLRDEEREDFGARANGAVAEQPMGAGIDPQKWVQSRRYNEMTPLEVLADLRIAREEAVAWLRSLSLEDLERGTVHPVHGRFRAGDFITAWRRHDLLHLKQITRALLALNSSEFADYRIGYAG